MPHRERHRNRITFLTPGAAKQTAASQVAILAKALKLRNWNVSVVEFGGDEPTNPGFERAGIAFVQAGKGLRALIRTAAYLKEFRPHIVHCHSAPSYLHGRVTRLVSPSSVLISTQYGENEASPWKKRFCRLTNRLCGVHTGSAQQDDTIWVPRAIELTLEPNPDSCRSKIRIRHDWEGKFIWLCIPGSDLGSVIEAFRLLRLSQPVAKLVLLPPSGTSCEPELSAEILPSDSNLSRYAFAADALLLGPSQHAFEAYLAGAAAQKTVVMTGDSFADSLIQDDVIAIVAGDNTPTSIADALGKCMTFTEDRRSSMGGIAKSRVEAVHGVEHVLTKWENIYEQLLESEQTSVFGQSRKWLTSAWSNSWRNS